MDLSGSDKIVHQRLCLPLRPVPPMPCRLGCGEMFEGGAHRLLELEEERLMHEQVSTQD